MTIHWLQTTGETLSYTITQDMLIYGSKKKKKGAICKNSSLTHSKR